MIIIFSFSHQTGSDSSHLSLTIVQWIQNHLNIPLTEFMIRKGAHMSEYALLSLSFYYGFSHLEIHQKITYISSLAATFIYACTDEFHQLFIGGRAGQLTDVMIDTCGGIIMIIFIFLINRHFQK